VRNARGQFAYVTVGGLNEVKVFRTDDFSLVATIPVGKLPHGIWPSGDGARVYVGLENDDKLIAIDTLTNKVIATLPIGQAPQAVNYVPDAVPEGDGMAGLQTLGVAGEAAHFTMVLAGRTAAAGAKAPTSVTLFDQGLTQVLEASATGLEPKHPYVLGLASSPDGTGAIEPLASFMTNPAGAQIVNAVGPIRQVVRGGADAARRYLVILPGSTTYLGKPVQVQAE
jgi:YVTN family beta-propeller protein